MSDRRPVAFADCFGRLRSGSRRRGVVLCPAFGLEGLTARRAWGDLGDRLAAAGLPTLDFDWPGTGDSLGDDRAPDRLAHWRAGAAAAIDRLIAETGVDEVAVVGLRLGATVAVEVAAAHPAVTRFVALAPVVSGRPFVREQRSLARLLRVRAETDPPDADEIGGWAVGGFFTSDATGEALTRLDLRHAAPPADAVLLLARAGDGLVEPLAEHWRAGGARVEVAPFDGFETFLTDPTATVAPICVWERVVAHLAEGAAYGDASAVPTVREPARLDGGGFVEEPVVFGPGDRLFGVLATPKVPRPTAPTVIVLPAGRNPHVGWGRGTVELARALAGDGRRVLRMDQAGVGDSLAHPDGPAEVLYSSEAIADVVAAMDRLSDGGDHGFVLVGSCSGAHLALHAALADPRVVAVAMINLLRFVWRPGDSLVATKRGEFRSSAAYAGLARRADAWKRLLTGRVKAGAIAGELARRLGARVWAKVLRLFATDPALRFLAAFERRGVRVLFVFGTDDGGRDEFAEHVGAESDLPRIAPGARLALIERTDHNVGPRDARERLRGLIQDFLGEVDAAPERTWDPSTASRTGRA